MQNIQTSEFLHLLGHFSGSAVSWDVFRGDGTARRFRGHLYGGVFFLGLGVVVARTETPFNPIDGPSMAIATFSDGHRWHLNYRPAHGGSCGTFLG